MGGPEMAPHTPPSASRSSRGLDRSGSPDGSSDRGVPDGMTADAPPSASRSSRGVGRSGSPDGSGEREVPDRATAGDRDVVVVTHPHVHVRDADLSGHERDTLVLTAEERQWGRRRVTTTGGRTLALALPTGTTLTPGEILHVGPDWYLIVEGAPEPVLVVTPGSGKEALRIAFEVGNRHFTLALDGERLLVPDDRAMDQLLTRLGVPFERAQAVFVPIGTGHRHDG
jgi:urease accessory protein